MRRLFNKASIRLLVFVYVLLAFTFSACVKEFKKPLATITYSPLLAAPLVNSSLTIKDLLVRDNTNGTIHTDSTNFLTLVYRGHLLSLEADSIIKFPSQMYSTATPPLTNSDVTTFNALPVGASQTLPVLVDTIDFNTNNTAEIDSVVFKPGTILAVSISSQFTQDAIIHLEIPSATKNGIPFSQTFNITYSGTVPVNFVANVDLSSYLVDMTEGGTTSNKFNIDYTITLMKVNNNPVNSSDNASFSEAFDTPLFEKLFGYIMQPLLSPGIDTVAISVFHNAAPGGGSFTLVNPQVTFSVSNSYGAPINATFNTLEGYNPGHLPYPVTITNPAYNPWQLPYPTIAQIGQSAKDSIILSNATTGNTLGAALNATPQYFIYSVNAEANPSGKPVPPNINFALDTSRFIVDFQFNIPLWGTASNIVFLDTIPFTLQASTLDAIQSMMIRINATNGFPIDMAVQGYFTDSISPAQPYNVLDSIVSPYQVIIPSATVDAASGKVIAAVNKITDNTFDKTRINNIKNVQKLIIKGTVVTANNGKTNVKLYSDYSLNIKIGVLAQLQTKI